MYAGNVRRCFAPFCRVFTYAKTFLWGKMIYTHFPEPRFLTNFFFYQFASSSFLTFPSLFLLTVPNYKLKPCLFPPAPHLISSSFSLYVSLRISPFFLTLSFFSAVLSEWLMNVAWVRERVKVNFKRRIASRKPWQELQRRRAWERRVWISKEKQERWDK